MNKHTFLPICCLFLCSFFSAYPQAKIQVYPNTTQHPPSFAAAHPERRSFLGPGQSALKVNLSSLLRADLCLSYEKKINRLFSIELTAGVTRYDPVTEALDFFNFHPYNIVPAKRQYSMSPSAKAGLRYYFETGPQEISGPYFSIEGMYRSYGYTIKNNYATPSLAHEYSNQREIRALYGWQNNDLRDVAFYDCSMGFGYRFHERKYLGYYEAGNLNKQTMLRSVKNYFVFVINLKIGFMLR